MTNPFAQNVPATQQQPAQPAAPAAPAAVNPFAQGQQQAAQPAYAPHPAPQGPYAQQQAAPAAPQAYAPPQAPPQGAPNPFAGPTAYSPPPGVSHMQHVQQTYRQNQQGQAAQQAAPIALGAASAPPPPISGGGKGAKLADMYGRLVVIFPHSLGEFPKNPQYITEADRVSGNLTQTRMTATVVVLDGGAVDNMAPLQWGGNPHVVGGRPHTNTDPLPYVRKAMWINQSQVIGQCTSYLPGGPSGGPGNTPGVVVGRILKQGPEHNSPWYLSNPTEQEINLANAYLGLVTQGTYPHPLAP